MNETAWFEATYDSYADYCFRLARQLLGGADAALDVVQDAFLAMWKRRGELTAHPNIGGWLTVTVRNRAMTLLREQSRREKRYAYSLDEVECEMTAAPDLTPEQQAELLSRMEALQKLLGEENAEMFVAFVIGGHKAKELAARYGMKENRFYMRISRMKKKLAAHPELFYALLLLSLGAAPLS